MESWEGKIMGKNLPLFTPEEMAVDEAQGFPKAYATICRNALDLSPFSHGPPFSFVPYALKSHEKLRMKKLSKLFPIIAPEDRDSGNPGSYVEFLWDRLDHLGNSGFDPALFRVDPFGNVLYWHADPASPLAWGIDHWFPCSRGGKTVPTNLRILQWQVCRTKKNQLDFLIPWWDLQLGISANQFLTIFASSNSDFRSRAISFLFQDDGSEEQNMKSHVFPQKFMDAKKKLGLVPAAIVSPQNSSEPLVLKAADLNRSLRPSTSFPSVKSLHKEADALQRINSSVSKENNQPLIDDYKNDPYKAISCARDSLRHRNEAKKLQSEIHQLEDELNELKQKNDSERIALQELEAMLTKKRKRVEKCRKLAESQASYRSLLEKMIRDAMHQTVVYKEQLRLNQAASNALMARLETQRAACDSSENELRKKNKQKDKMEIQARSCSDQGRKRLRNYDDLQDNGDASNLSSTRKVWRPTKRELREFLEEEQKASEAGISFSFDKEGEWEEENVDETAIATNEVQAHWHTSKICLSEDGIGQCTEKEINDEMEAEDEEGSEEYRNRVGKGHVEKWLHILLENTKEGLPPTQSNCYDKPDSTCTGISQNETIGRTRSLNSSDTNRTTKGWKGAGGSMKETSEGLLKFRCTKRFNSLPYSSPSVRLGMRKSAPNAS